MFVIHHNCDIIAASLVTLDQAYLSLREGNTGVGSEERPDDARVALPNFNHLYML